MYLHTKNLSRYCHSHTHTHTHHVLCRHLSAHTPRLAELADEDGTTVGEGSAQTVADDDDDDGGKHAAADVAHSHLAREVFEVERVIKVFIVRCCTSRADLPCTLNILV